MPQLHTRVEIKLQDPICQRLDRCRGDVPRATWIREAIVEKLNGEESREEFESDNTDKHQRKPQ